MRSAWRAMAVASLSMTMLLSGSAALAADPQGTALPDSWPKMTIPAVDPVIEKRLDTAAPPLASIA